MLDALSRLRDGRSKRISSWDTSGRNGDAWPIAPGECRALAEIAGAGVVRHIWFTIACEDPIHLRKAVLRMYWDGQDHPSVETPVGDFFGVGHAKVASYSCSVLNMSANQGNDTNAAMNCYFPMPFSDGARIEIENQGEKEIRSFYFYVDYEDLPSLPKD